MEGRDRARGFLLVLLCVGPALTKLSRIAVPQGPLHRVEGSHVSLSCNVSHYKGSDGLDFEWSLLHPSEPPLRMGLISTRNEAFTHASFQHRVLAGEIRIRRTSPSSVQLLIRKLRKTDAGNLECCVPPAAGRHHDPYKAYVTLRVLPDTLQLTAPEDSPVPLSLQEGKPFALHCEAASLSAVHTHLSVHFVLVTGERRAQWMVAGLDRDQVLSSEPGGHFWSRFTQGEVGLQRLGYSSYHLHLQHVQPEDAGRYDCVAAQWLQDPDGHWQKIKEKSVSLVDLSVQPNDMVMHAAVSVVPGSLYQGDMVTLLCNVSLGQPLGDGQLSVGWWGPAEEPLLLLDRRGISLNTPLGGRSAPGTELGMDRPAEFCFRLRLYGAHRKDQGHFHCRVGLWTQNEAGHWYQSAEASSPPTTLFLYLTPWDTLLLPAVVGVVTALTVSIAIIAAVTCCFLRRLARRRGTK
ncbi:immunoglobulin superfamily member 8 isoform X1 [Hemitrygon akajei]|uniref:immunoglobulin superfamily member 8 isoform X1 n=2 Tax=Hemitrygon akajei TaxID=2704970 RepID=UPI003BF975D4